MKKQITHITVHQTSKVIAATHAVLMALLVVLPSALGFLFQGHVITAVLIFIFLPLVAWLILYVGYVVAFWFYNLVIPYTGGIELTFAEVKEELEIDNYKN